MRRLAIPLAVMAVAVLVVLAFGSRLYQVVGLQTDYTEAGRGLLSPPMLTAILQAARA